MKYYLFSLFLLLALSAKSQTPAQINYQGVARDMSGTVIQNTNMRVRFTIYDNSPDGPKQYTETRMIQTNKFGLFSVAIGSTEGIITSSGKLTDVNWALNSKYLGVEIDPKGGNNFIQLGVSPLLSVPYSLYSLSSKDGLPSMKGHGGKLLMTNGNIAKWDTLHIPNYTAGAGLKIDKEHITVTDTAIFNASRIMNGRIDITGRKNNNVLSWDSTSNTYKYVPVEIITGPNKKFLQGGNSFGSTATLGTTDNFDLQFIRNNQWVGNWTKLGELNSKYFTVQKQFLGASTFSPSANNDPPIDTLPDGTISWYYEKIPTYSFMEDPKTGIGYGGNLPLLNFIHKGQSVASVYWEDDGVGEVSVIQGYGTNRLSIQSNSNIVHIAQTSRYEWEGLGIPYIDFIGYEAGSFNGKTIRISSDDKKSAVPLAVMPFNKTDAFYVIDSADNVKTRFNSEGWIGINVAEAKAPLHVSVFDALSNKPIALFENGNGQEVFSYYNNRKSYFGERVYYRTNPIFKPGDDLALVPKKYVDDLFLANGLDINGAISPTAKAEQDDHILVNPDTALDQYEVVFPSNPVNGQELYLFFGGTIKGGTVVEQLVLPAAAKNSVLPATLPSNIQAGQVICFRWFEETKMWYRKM